jgi:DNA-binding NtrC family response regulator
MKRILIVDDDAPTRELLKDILAAEGYALAEAGDGREALLLLTKSSVDLVITDRSMPGMGGLELLAQLKAAHPNMPALMISAYGEEKMWGEAIGSGAQDYILKPFKPDDIIKAVKKILSSDRA